MKVIEDKAEASLINFLQFIHILFAAMKPDNSRKVVVNTARWSSVFKILTGAIVPVCWSSHQIYEWIVRFFT